MDSSFSYNDDGLVEDHLTKSRSLEIAYQESLRNVDLIFKDEGARRLRLRILLLENENNDLHEQLALGDDRIEALEQERDEVQALFENARKDSFRLENELRAQTRELSNVKATLDAMDGITADSAKVLTQKLSLARELATLKPELEHLRSQVSYQHSVLSEKLALQRQVTTLEVELEAEKRASKRAVQKATNHREAEFQQQLESLQKDLGRERQEAEKLRCEAEKAPEAEKKAFECFAQKHDSDREAEFQRELERILECLSNEKREGDKSRKEVNKLVKELQTQKRASERAVQEDDNSQQLADVQQQLENLQKDLAQERRERDAIRKEVEKETKASGNRQLVQESKLNQMRTKLRITKEQLKECQAELSHVRAAAVNADSTRFSNGVQKSRRRTVREMSMDGAIDTPNGVAALGERPAMKRRKMDQSLSGEKSMFSITPFLNRTVIMTETPPKDPEPGKAKAKYLSTTDTTYESAEECMSEQPGDVSPPTIARAKSRSKVAGKTSTPERHILGQAKANTKNKKPGAKRSHPLSTLEKVTEEGLDENEQSDLVVEKAGESEVYAKATTLQPSKLLAKNAANDETGPMKKKRKLLGGGKTLFDENDDEVTKRPAKVNLSALRRLGNGGLAGPKGGLKGGLGGSGLAAFSPLKKDRRGVGASFLA